MYKEQLQDGETILRDEGAYAENRGKIDTLVEQAASGALHQPLNDELLTQVRQEFRSCFRNDPLVNGAVITMNIDTRSLEVNGLIVDEEELKLTPPEQIPRRIEEALDRALASHRSDLPKEISLPSYTNDEGN